jgi:hypothetical protein
MHIGSHKAGSTSIQEYCQGGPAALREAGIHYPLGGLPRHAGQHSALKDLVIQDRMGEVAAFLEAAAAAARAQGAGVVLLSGEGLCVFGPGLAHRFQGMAAGVFSQTEIVLLRAGLPPAVALPVEDVIADGLTRRFDDADWVVPEVPGLLERHAMARPELADSAALCAAMAALYAGLQAHFCRKDKAAAPADALPSTPAD